MLSTYKPLKKQYMWNERHDVYIDIDIIGDQADNALRNIAYSRIYGTMNIYHMRIESAAMNANGFANNVAVELNIYNLIVVLYGQNISWANSDNVTIYNSIALNHSYEDGNTGFNSYFLRRGGNLVNTVVPHGVWDIGTTNSYYLSSFIANEFIEARYSGFTNRNSSPVVLDEDYNISGIEWENIGVGNNIDGTQAHLGVYGGPYTWR